MLYKLLFSLQSVNDPARSKWESDLNVLIPKPVCFLCFLNYNVSLNIALRENHYKLLHR